MARKILFAEGGATDALKSVHTSDKEGLGVLYEDEYGRVYRYVKNAGSTALAAAGCCLKKLGATTAKGVVQRVLAPDAATGPATCLVRVAGGVPVTGICGSGSATGDHGWVQVSGPARVTIMPSSTAVDQEAGCCAIATTLFPATFPWGKGNTSTIDSTAGGVVTFNHVRFAASLGASTGVTTAHSGVVMVHCLN